MVNPGRPLQPSPGSAPGPITCLLSHFLGLQTGSCLQNQPLHPTSKHLPAVFFFFLPFSPNTQICLARSVGQKPSRTAQKVNFQALSKRVHNHTVSSSPLPAGTSFFQDVTLTLPTVRFALPPLTFVCCVPTPGTLIPSPSHPLTFERRTVLCLEWKRVTLLRVGRIL